MVHLSTHQATSSRLPDVSLLKYDVTGPEFFRWRRGIEFALETKGTWKYCSGEAAMPMPEAGPHWKLQTTSPRNSSEEQPSLLEERRAWVRQDREVKLDIFLSLTEEIMHEVFEVGPPLPPSNMTAQEMLRVLTERFGVSSFQAYHHAFCHFLNLHVDQYATIEDFNEEFSTTLEDLVDYGHPLSSTQAISAYFSKLRCTQNPWVAEILDKWDTQPPGLGLGDLMKIATSWPSIRPLEKRLSCHSHAESIPDEYLEGSSTHSHSDAATRNSFASTVSSKYSQSMPASSTAHSQVIMVHASSEDVTEIKPDSVHNTSNRVSTVTIPEPLRLKKSVPDLSSSRTNIDTTPLTPENLNPKTSLAQMPLPAPIDRPLPPLPTQTNPEARARSASPRLQTPTLTSASPMQLETTHPKLRPQPSPPLAAPRLSDHPAFRDRVAESSTEHLYDGLYDGLYPMRASTATATAKPSASITSAMKPYYTIFPPLPSPRFMSSTPNLVAPTPSPPDTQQQPQRPHSSRAAPIQRPTRIPSSASSISVLSLPLQGTLRSSPLDTTSTSTPPPASPCDSFTALPALPLSPPMDMLLLRARTPTFDDILPSVSFAPTAFAMAALSRGESGVGVEGRGMGEERKQQQQRRKKMWSVNVGINLARFSHSKGVREMI